MTTDKTPATLATVKHGGCVQLGASERARFDAFLRDNPFMALMAGTAWQVWQAALTAQPSPGGQGDALVTDAMVMAALQAVTRETLAGVGDCDSKVIGVLTAYGIDGAVDIPTMVRAMLEAALAARQPVGEPVAVVTTSERFAYGKLNRDLPDGTKLYAAPPAQQPAQAVDLGQFRAQVAELLRSEFDMEVADPEDHRHDDGAGEAYRVATKISALIDSHAEVRRG